MKQTKLIKHYAISESTFVIQGRIINGKLCTVVYDRNGYSVINVKPNILIGRSLRNINSTLAHARDVSKTILGDRCKKLPLVIGNHFGQPIILFPLFSPKSKDNIWIVYNSITRIGGDKNSILIEFKHQHEWTSNTSRQIFNNQYVNATNLYKAVLKRWNQ